MVEHGYKLLHESEDVLNFAGKRSELGRVDFLLAHRKYALAMLKNALPKRVLDDEFTVKVIRMEDLIGLKLQSGINDPQRFAQDTADIKALLYMHKNSLRMEVIREYFSVFGKERELDSLLKEINNA